MSAVIRTEEIWQDKAACRGPHATVFFPPDSFERKEQKEPAAEPHGFSGESQIFASCHSPLGSMIKSCTFARKAMALRR